MEQGDERAAKPSRPPNPAVRSANVLNPACKVEYDNRSQEHDAAWDRVLHAYREGRDPALALAERDLAYSRMGSDGEFWPVFGHDEIAGWQPIYPTVPTDLGTVIRITKLMFSLLAERAAAG